MEGIPIGMQDLPLVSAHEVRSRHFRIVGDGMAGCLLALALLEQGCRITVHGAPLEGASTPIAPGIVNPLAGRKFRAPEHLESLLAALQRAVERVSRILGVKIWHPLPILRLFSDPEQPDRFLADARHDNRLAYVGRLTGPDEFPFVHNPYGGFLSTSSGWANLPLLQRSARSWLRDANALLEEPYRADPVRDRDAIVIFCEGWQVANNPYWSFIPHNPAKGEMLIVRFSEPLPRDHIFNRSCWAQPIEDDLWRIGATYSWSAFNSNPSERAARDLQERLQHLTPLPFSIVDQVAGVRPIVEDYRPIIGPHPTVPNWFILNALGSKGTLQAPLAVEWLLAHLLDGEALPPAWSVKRFC